MCTTNASGSFKSNIPVISECVPPVDLGQSADASFMGRMVRLA